MAGLKILQVQGSSLSRDTSAFLENTFENLSFIVSLILVCAARAVDSVDNRPLVVDNPRIVRHGGGGAESHVAEI